MAVAHRHADIVVTPASTARDARALARAEFFQTVREILAVSRGSIGADARANEEPLRFRVADGMRHPDAEIVELKPAPNGGAISMTVGHMGLSGPMGVMPDHYSDLLVERRRGRDEALARFLDLFNHRAISLFYRAWAKYRLPVRFEEGGGAYTDPFSNSLAALAGIARLEDPSLLAAAAPLSRQVRSPGALKRIIATMFALPIEVVEMRPRWIRIDPSEQTRLGAHHQPKGNFAALSGNAVIGTSACDVAGRFRLRIGPLDWPSFSAFFEADGIRRRLVEAVRFAVGGTIDFDLQLVLRADAVPRMALDRMKPAALSRTAWLLAGASPIDRADAVLPGAA